MKQRQYFISREKKGKEICFNHCAVCQHEDTTSNPFVPPEEQARSRLLQEEGKSESGGVLHDHPLT